MVTKKAAKKTTKKTAKKATKKAARKASPSSSSVEARLAAFASEVAEQPPGEPIAQLAALSLRTVEIGKPALAQLVKLADFERHLITELAGAAQLLAKAEAVWSAARAKSRAGVAPARVKEGEGLKSDLVAAGRYLLRKDPVVQQQLDQIAEGTGVADLALDLAYLSSLAQTHAQRFADGGVSPATVSSAAKLSGELNTGVDPADASDLQARRNRLFHLVKTDTSELRAALRYLWRKQPTKLAQLGAGYAAQLKHGRRQSKTTTTPA
ncbi:MAG: hypothetical protein Q8O67_11820 [Deltaproteobacteria bacterium]|nr:hypothetical protein [Deltaproteobacteria bacterium]